MKRDAKKSCYICLLLNSLFNGLVFYAPIALLVRTRTGLSVSEFFYLQVILSTSIFMLEIPGGILADKIGYRKSIIISQSVLLVARIILANAGNFALFAIEAVLEGLSASLISGTTSAYIYTFYKGEEYALVSSRISSWGTIGFVFSTVLYAILLPIVDVIGLLNLTCITSLGAVISTLFLPNIEYSPTSKSTPIALCSTGKWLLPKNLSFFIVPLSALSIAGLIINFFYASKVNALGLRYEMLSFIILGYSAVELLAPVIIKRIRKPQYWQCIKLMSAAISICFFLLFWLKNLMCIPIMLILPLLSSVVFYLLDELINERLDALRLDDRRATVLSILNMGNNLLDILFLFTSALLSDDDSCIAFLFVAVYFSLLWIFVYGILRFREKLWGST